MRWIAVAALIGVAMGCARSTSPVEAPAPTWNEVDRGPERTLDANALYAGLEATRVLLKDGALALDTRNWPKRGGAGVITTDVIDLGGTGVLTPSARVSDLKVDVSAKAVPPGALSASVRTGTTYFQSPGTWTDWEAVARSDALIQPRGRYAQVRLTLTTTDTSDSAVLPSVSGLKLTYAREMAPAAGQVTLAENRVQRIVNSVVKFDYERPDQPDLVWMRKTFKLDDVIAGKKGEFEQLKALMDWTASRRNKRPEERLPDGSYPWHIRTVLKDEDGGSVYGHCMSYCETFIAAVGSFGWQARHFAIQGFRDTSHEVPEVWVNELGKWVFMDPSLDTIWLDPKTREPLNLLEMHSIYVNFVFRPGEQQRRGQDVNLARVEALRGKHPIICVTNDWTYGEKKPWDWEYSHGYMTAGWLQLTPRNTWNSQHEPWCQYFEWGPDGYCGFPVYLDEHTPLVEPTTALWYTRKRDLWWTMNQASFRLVRSGDAALAVECGQSQPFFKRFLAKIDDGGWQPVEPAFTWTLKPGLNRLTVTCEDEFGKQGLSSTVVVRYEAK